MQLSGRSLRQEQHTDDRILYRINRECYTKHTYNAIKLLLDNSFKVDIHIMPDLPGASVAIDKAMFDYVYSLMKVIILYVILNF